LFALQQAGRARQWVTEENLNSQIDGSISSDALQCNQGQTA